MAAVAITDFNVLKKLDGDFADVILLSPGTMDSADTVDVSSLVADGQVLFVFGWDVESGDEVTATYAIATGIITVDAAGGTTNHTYAIRISYVGWSFAP